MAEKAEAKMNPITTLRELVQKRLAWGSSKVNGRTQRMETHMTYLRPILSPTGPPIYVPAATAARKRKTSNCAFLTVSTNVPMRETEEWVIKLAIERNLENIKAPRIATL